MHLFETVKPILNQNNKPKPVCLEQTGKKYSRAICPRFSVCFSILITSLGEEGAGLCASSTFVCFARICFCHFSLPLGVEGWLQFVIVAYHGPLY